MLPAASFRFRSILDTDGVPPTDLPVPEMSQPSFRLAEAGWAGAPVAPAPGQDPAAAMPAPSPAPEGDTAPAPMADQAAEAPIAAPAPPPQAPAIPPDTSRNTILPVEAAATEEPATADSAKLHAGAAEDRAARDDGAATAALPDAAPTTPPPAEGPDSPDAPPEPEPAPPPVSDGTMPDPFGPRPEAPWAEEDLFLPEEPPLPSPDPLPPALPQLDLAALEAEMEELAAGLAALRDMLAALPPPPPWADPGLTIPTVPGLPDLGDLFAQTPGTDLPLL